MHLTSLKSFSEQEIFDNWAEDMELDMLAAIERNVGIEFAEALTSSLGDCFNNKQVQHLFDVYLEYNYDRIEIEEQTYFVPKHEESII